MRTWCENLSDLLPTSSSTVVLDSQASLLLVAGCVRCSTVTAHGYRNPYVCAA